MQFGFSKARHKITPRGKSGRGPRLGEFPEIWGSPLIFLQRLQTATSRLAGRWALPRPITKSHPEEKVGVVMGYGSSLIFWGYPLIFQQRLKVATSNLVCSLGLPRPIIKSHAEEKDGVALG